MEWVNVIREAGLRVTRQRVAVLEAVTRRPHSSAAVVLADIANVLPEVSHQAVYDCLAHLTAAGLLQRLTVDGGPMLYETRVQDRHDHFICRSCNTVVDVDVATEARPRLDLRLAEGVLVDEVQITYRGICAPCAAVGRPPALHRK